MPAGGWRARPQLVQLVVVAFCVFGGSAAARVSPSAVADSTVPPAGAPALDVMALSVDDLEPGASIQRQGYTKQPDFTLYYRREFKPGASLGPSKLLVLDSEVGLDETADAAANAVASIESVLRSKKGRVSLARAALEDAGRSLTGLRVSSPGIRKLTAGDAAFVFPLTVLMPRHVRLSVVLEVVRVDRVIQVLYLVGQVNRRIVTTEAARLLGVVAGRMVSGLLPVVITAPSIADVPRVGQTATADPGSWTNSPSSFAVQWLRCDPTGADCAPVDGATGLTYAPATADIGSTLEVSVVATNAVGSSQTALSAPSAVVLAGS
jgi:hypothetical protein